jgi:XRE family transcriptional regulator, aerobic/anaerobic benzoate catabolism transcriptional regulator
VTELKTGRANEAASTRIAAAQAGAFAAEIGRLVRLGRAKRGVTRRRLAADSGISERYLAQIESGRANPSVIVLKAIAEAIDVAIIELMPRSGERSAALNAVLDLVARMPPSELPALALSLERGLAESTGDRGRRIALVGLRGAGKSTLGRRLAAHFDVPFVELDKVVEQEYGASVALLIEMSGVATFRRHERGCLEHIIAAHDRVVIAAGGGIVADPETYALLLRRTHTVWVKARPDEHMSRVIAQGDFRPMAQNREAMTDLIAILDARRDDYARAEAQLDTSGEDADHSFARLLRIARPWTLQTGRNDTSG